MLVILKERFLQCMHRHQQMQWEAIAARLEAGPHLLWSLYQMEATGGEPDVTDYDAATDKFLFCDCSAESPAGRRSLCYDEAALAARKQQVPAGSAMGMAAAMGITLLTEAHYRALQQLQPVDTKTSSWIDTPVAIRELGGSLFADRRYNQVFIYHNGASSYYAARGFRGLLWI